MRKLLRRIFLAAFLPVAALAQEGQWNSACFGGLNDAVIPAVLPDCESPDMLNVESNLDGTAILKRKGFSKFADLAVATSPVNGSHSFIDSSGNRLDIVCHDRICAKSTNGNAFANFITTAAVGITRWSFVDQGGILYGANNKRDPIMKYDGTTRSSPATMPAGSILELAQDRLAVGDISGQPNRVHYSSSGAYEMFTLGVNPEDSFFDDIGAAGDRVRGIKCVTGNCFIFKTASITMCEMANQYNTRCSVISPNIGTTEPAAIIAAGSSLYFVAQDKNYWEISPSGLRQISKKIPNLVKSQSGGLAGGENTNTQTTKADWDAGVQNPLLSWNTAIVNGSIFPSSTSFVDASTVSFALGSFTGSGVNFHGLEFAGVTSTYVFRYEADVLPASDGWTKTGSPTESVAGSSLTFTTTANIVYSKSFTAISLPTSAMFVFRAAKAQHSGTGSSRFRIMNGAGNVCGEVRIKPNTVDYMVGLTATSESLVQPTYSTYTVIITTKGVATCGNVYYYRDGVFKSSGSTGFGVFDLDQAAMSSGDGAVSMTTFVDFFHISSGAVTPDNIDIPAISTFTSRIFDTAFTTPTSGPFKSTQTLPTGTAITYALRTSTSPNNDLWGSYDIVVPPARPTAYTNRYWQYKITLKHSNLVESPGVIGASLIIATTGQYRMQCIQPNSSISAWGTFSCAQTIVGNGSEVFYATSALTCAALPTTPPVNNAGDTQSGWTAQTNNATVTIATNTAVYIGWRSLLPSATDQAQVDSCVLAWNEGTPSQPAWAVYDSVKNAIYWTTTINSGGYANRLLKYDRNLEQWFPMSIQAQAPSVINNSLYFGSASSGTWNLYGGVDSDNGLAINGYRVSKDVGADSPFVGKSFKSISVLSRNNGSGSLTGTWTLSNAQTGSYTISLSTGAGISYARSNFLIPFASPQQFLNVKVGNNSSTPFEVLGIGIKWQVLPWKVEGP